MRDQILLLFRSNPEQSYSKTQIAKTLEIPGDRKGEMTGILIDLIEAKVISCGAKNLYALTKPPEIKAKPDFKKSSTEKSAIAKPSPKGSLTGSIKFLPNGHAFFYPVIGDPDNEASGIDFKIHSRIFIPRDKTKTSPTRTRP